MRFTYREVLGTRLIFDERGHQIAMFAIGQPGVTLFELMRDRVTSSATHTLEKE
jgi:hypothetical protein